MSNAKDTTLSIGSTQTVNKTSTLVEFTLFPKLPKELRCKIFKHALPTDADFKTRTVLQVTADPIGRFYHPQGKRMGFSLLHPSDRERPAPNLTLCRGLSSASFESRGVYIAALKNLVPGVGGNSIIRYDASTTCLLVENLENFLYRIDHKYGQAFLKVEIMRGQWAKQIVHLGITTACLAYDRMRVELVELLTVLPRLETLMVFVLAGSYRHKESSSSTFINKTLQTLSELKIEMNRLKQLTASDHEVPEMYLFGRDGQALIGNNLKRDLGWKGSYRRAYPYSRLKYGQCADDEDDENSQDSEDYENYEDKEDGDDGGEEEAEEDETYDVDDKDERYKGGDGDD